MSESNGIRNFRCLPGQAEPLARLAAVCGVGTTFDDLDSSECDALITHGRLERQADGLVLFAPHAEALSQRDLAAAVAAASLGCVVDPTSTFIAPRDDAKQLTDLAMEWGLHWLVNEATEASDAARDGAAVLAVELLDVLGVLALLAAVLGPRVSTAAAEEWRNKILSRGVTSDRRLELTADTFAAFGSLNSPQELRSAKIALERHKRRFTSAH